MSLPLREYVAIPVELSLLLFHVSVTVFVAEKVRRRNPSFRNAFFQLYLSQCIANLMCYVTLLINRLSDVYEFITSEAVGVVFVTIYQFSSYFQLGIYTVININRWTAIVYPVSHQVIWKGPWFRISVVVAIALSVALAMMRPVLAGIFFWTYSYGFTVAWSEAGFIRAVTVSTVNFGATLVDLVMEAWSFIVYRRMDSKKRRHHSENFRLLVFTTLEMIPQILKVIYYALLGARISTAPFDVPMHYVLTIQALSAPIILCAISSFLRRGYKAFYGFGKESTKVLRISVTKT